MSETIHKGRSFRFSLRTLFIAITALSVILAVVALKLRQDVRMEAAQKGLAAMGLQMSTESLPNYRNAFSITCRSPRFDDQHIEQLLAHVATLARYHDLGVSPGVELVRLDLTASSISEAGEQKLRQALPNVEIKR